MLLCPICPQLAQSMMAVFMFARIGQSFPLCLISARYLREKKHAMSKHATPRNAFG